MQRSKKATMHFRRKSNPQQARRRYCVTRKELLAVVSFIKHFRPCLLGKCFIFRTNHGSLAWLFQVKDPEGQLVRWLEKLQEYEFTIEHRPGRKHQNADADSLSRIPYTQCGRSSHTKRPVPVSALNLQGGPLSGVITTRPMQTVTRRPHSQCHSSGKRGRESDFLKDQNLGCRQLMQRWEKLQVIKEVLWRQFKDDQGQGNWRQH